MRLLCTSCGERFDSTGDRPRCPRCLRQHGLEELTADGRGRQADGRATWRARWRRHGARLALFLFTGAILCAGLHLLLRGWQRPANGSWGGLSEGSLRRELLARGLASADIVLPFAADDEIRRFARQAATGEGGEARARALARALRGLLGSAALRLRRPLVPHPRPPLAASDLFRMVRSPSSGQPLEVNSYEVAALALASARAAKLPALLAEVTTLDGRPADPSGELGYFVVAIYAARAALQLGQPPLVVLDPVSQLKPGRLQPLDDLTAVAYFYSLRALDRLDSDGDPALAYREMERAQRLARAASATIPRAATLVCARARVLLAAGGESSAIAAYRWAVRLADDAPRRRLLALALLSAGNLAGAAAALREALAHTPGFVPARVSLAEVLLVQGEPAAAEKELEGITPKTESAQGLHFVRGILRLAQAKPDRQAAEKELSEAVLSEPWDERAWVALYGLLLGEGRAADAAALREQALRSQALRPGPRAARLRAQLERLAAQAARGTAGGTDAGASRGDRGNHRAEDSGRVPGGDAAAGGTGGSDGHRGTGGTAGKADASARR